jgi:mutator family transposase
LSQLACPSGCDGLLLRRQHLRSLLIHLLHSLGSLLQSSGLRGLSCRPLLLRSLSGQCSLLLGCLLLLHGSLGSCPGSSAKRLRTGGHGMRVMSDVINPMAREHTMTKVQGKGELIDIKALLGGDAEFLRAAVKAAIEAALEAEMTETLGAAKGERSETRLGYRAGYYHRSLITRVGTLELRVPQDRAGRFSTELFERYQRSEKALVSALAEMYVQGVSTRKVKGGDGDIVRSRILRQLDQ